MSDNYLNQTGLRYYHDRIKQLFAKQADLDTLDDKVDQIIAEGGEPNVIEIVKVNNTPLTPDANKAVNVSVPTKTSDITNDSAYQTATQVADAIAAAVTSAYKYKGSVATYNDLPSSGQTTGDVYDVRDTGVNYAWNGTAWDALGSYVDMTLYWAKAELVAITTAQIDVIIA